MSVRVTCRVLPALALLVAGVAACGRSEPPSIDDFFRTFTDEWVRSNPNQAIQARYFTGPEQDALEVQMTPLTRDWRHQRTGSQRPPSTPACATWLRSEAHLERMTTSRSSPSAACKLRL